ncbi:hypothetical protein EGW08_009609, partial [Elysia chlorotica]
KDDSHATRGWPTHALHHDGQDWFVQHVCQPQLSVAQVGRCVLRPPEALVYLGGELVPAAHLTDVHPAGVAGALQVVPERHDLVLHVPLVAEEDLRPLQVVLWGGRDTRQANDISDVVAAKMLQVVQQNVHGHGCVARGHDPVCQQ